MANEHALELLLSRLENPLAKLASDDATNDGAYDATYLTINVGTCRYAYCDPCGSTNDCTDASCCIRAEITIESF